MQFIVANKIVPIMLAIQIIYYVKTYTRCL